MNKNKRIVALVMSFLATATLTGCAEIKTDGGDVEENTEINAPVLPPEEIEIQPPEIQAPEEEPPAEEPPQEEIPAVVPKVKTVTYVSVTGDKVNMRSGGGTGYAAYGSVDKSTMYAYDGEANGWFKTKFKNKTAYLSSNYCNLVEMTASEDERIEAVIAEGTKLLGTVYVYGAIRYHDGNGNRLKNFSIEEFDCSSLMQYIFSKGAGVNLQLTTRTQIYQGKTVKKSELKRGDLMFFTNASRKDKVGIERVGHVALYLGDNLILHTASDYAKIEQISPTRWSYFIQAQRIF